MNHSVQKYSNQTSDLWDTLKPKWRDENAVTYEKDVIAHLLRHTDAFDKAVMGFTQVEPTLRSALEEISQELQNI